jgi:ribonuclease VapC
MVLDTSALPAILFDEPESASIRNAIAQDATRLLSAASYLETAIVVETRFGESGSREMELLLARAQVEIVAFDDEQAKRARMAYRKWGKGRHPAGLSFGDCFSYALSKTTGEPLCFKGEDFTRTDVRHVDLEQSNR